MGAITVGPDGLDYVGWLDISGWQFNYAGGGKLKRGALPPDWSMAVNTGVSGISARILNGTTVDQSFKLAYDAWQQIGGPATELEFGPYIYLQPNALGPKGHVRLLLDQLQNYPDLTLRTMIDFEAYYGLPIEREAMADWLDELLATHLELIGHEAWMYWGHAFANINTVARSFARHSSSQPRYNRPGVVPPVGVAKWATWPRWDRQPVPNSIIGDWDSWQFSSDGNAQAYGCPRDGGTRIDCNIALLAKWADFKIPPPPPPPDPTPMPVPIPEPQPQPEPDPGPVIPPDEDDMTLYTARDGNGTVWIGDGVKRRNVGSQDVYAVYAFRSGAGSGPKLLTVSGHPAPSNPADLPISNDAVIESLGEHD